MKTATESNVNWWRLSVNVPGTENKPGGWMPLWVNEDMAEFIDRIKEFDNKLAVIDQESLKNNKDLIFI